MGLFVILRAVTGDPIDTAKPTYGPLSLGTKLLYGSGAMADGIKNAAFSTFLLFYYNAVLGLSGTQASLAIALALVADAITDPLMGFISDNIKTRWGRRHPFMYLAPVPFAVCMIFLFSPPDDLTSSGLFWWLLLFAIGVRASLTLFVIPHGALVPELTENYDERTSFVSYRFIFGAPSGILMTFIAYRFIFTPSEEFARGQLDPSSYPIYGVACAAVIFVAIIVSSVGTHHLIPRLKKPQELSLTPFRFLLDLKDVLSNRNYLMALFALVFASVTTGFEQVVGIYTQTYFWGLTTDQMSLLAAAYLIGMFVGVGAARPVSERSDKRHATLRIMAATIAIGPIPVILRLLDLMVPNGHPALLPIIWVHGLIVFSLLFTSLILLVSMITDLVDENELATGKRQEGMFGAAIAFSAKATSGLGTVIAGVMLDVISFPTGAAAGEVPADTLRLLGMAVGPGTVVLLLIMLFFLSRFKMTRERHAEILQALEARRSGAG